jgi:hypothetical protein
MALATALATALAIALAAAVVAAGRARGSRPGPGDARWPLAETFRQRDGRAPLEKVRDAVAQ